MSIFLTFNLLMFVFMVACLECGAVILSAAEVLHDIHNVDKFEVFLLSMCV